MKRSTLVFAVFTWMGCWTSNEEIPSSFDDSFGLGESVGKTQSLQSIVDQAQNLKGDHRANFLDGAAHTYRAPKSMSVDDMAQQIEAIVPKPHRDVFHDGVAQAIVEQYSGDPERVLPEIQHYQQVSHQPLYNGVRIALWRVFATDVLQGLAIAQAYPSEYHAPLMEELGWLLGDQYVNDLAADSIEWGGRALPKTECALLHGMVRGWWMHHLALKDVSTSDMLQQTRQLSKCSSMVWRGVGWAHVLIHGNESPEWNVLQSALTDSERRFVQSALKNDTLWESL